MAKAKKLSKPQRQVLEHIANNKGEVIIPRRIGGGTGYAWAMKGISERTADALRNAGLITKTPRGDGVVAPRIVLTLTDKGRDLLN